jgi:hypothetical protein
MDSNVHGPARLDASAGWLVVMYKTFAGLTVVALAVAILTAIAGYASQGDPRPVPAAVKADPLDLKPGAMSCLQEKWPYGCQWRDVSAAGAERFRAASPRGQFSSRWNALLIKRSVLVTKRNALLAKKKRTIAMTTSR